MAHMVQGGVQFFVYYLTVGFEGIHDIQSCF